MRLALAHAKSDTLQYLRYPAYAVPTLLFPALLLAVVGRAFEQGEPERMLAGFAAMALLTVAFFQFGVGIAMTRTSPWETYIRTLPVTPTIRLIARLLSALAFAAISVAVVCTVGVLLYEPHLGGWRVPTLVLALAAGVVPFGLLGIAFGYWLPPRAALPVANIAFLMLAIGGSLWRRPEGIPESADTASQLLPTRSWIEILDAVATGDSPVPWHHVAALAGWAVVFFALAWLGYVRDEGERFE
jgi:ABC-2 type transport system permease protein